MAYVVLKSPEESTHEGWFLYHSKDIPGFQASGVSHSTP